MPDPVAAVPELHRVLEPGGRLFCTVSLFFAEHQQPYDFHRFTQFGLRRPVEDAGFEIVRLTWLEGYLGTVSYQFSYMGQHLPGPRTSLHVGGWRGLRGRALLAVLRTAAPWVARELAVLDAAPRPTDTGMPKDYVVVARKPE
ncbi:MAG TPA: hypothetical protein VFJ28_01850 [Marmoricola sp.]|nr:hypothetical protein [Marmoricola sp.]